MYVCVAGGRGKRSEEGGGRKGEGESEEEKK